MLFNLESSFEIILIVFFFNLSKMWDFLIRLYSTITEKILDWNVYDGIVMEPDAENNCQSIANASAAFSRNSALVELFRRKWKTEPGQMTRRAVLQNELNRQGLSREKN